MRQDPRRGNPPLAFPNPWPISSYSLEFDPVLLFEGAKQPTQKLMQAEVPVSDLNLCLHILLQPFHEILYFHVVKNKRKQRVLSDMRLSLPCPKKYNSFSKMKHETPAPFTQLNKQLI